MGWNVYYYKTSSGKEPVREFIDEQDHCTQNQILQSVAALSKNGPFLKPPFIKKIKGKLYELRIKSNITIRIFYTPKENSYYLLHAFKKKSQKAPVREVKTALDRLGKLI